MASGRAWEVDEIREAIMLYCVTPFGRLHNRNPDIIALAHSLGRTANSVALKLCNFAALDESLDRQGMQNYSKLDAEVWADFFKRSILLLERPEETVPRPSGFAETHADFVHEGVKGRTIKRLANARQGQSFFRSMVLASYDSRCAVTGIAEPALLVASHIVPWQADAASRMNPSNGICLNALFDKAFDRGLVTFDEQYRTVFSPKMERTAKQHLLQYEGRQIMLPKKFAPSQDFLQHHRDVVFQI